MLHEELCERIIGESCNSSTRKPTKASRTVVATWKARGEDSGKLTVKVAGNTFECPDSPEGRFVEICNRVEALASMFVRIDDIRLPESILRHFRQSECGLTPEMLAKLEASQSNPVPA